MLWRLPEEVELAHGALIEPLAVALHGIEVSGAQPGQSVCVLGCGPIGAMAVVGLRARGFENVVVVEPNEQRRELALKLGASVALGLDGVHEAIIEAFDGSLPEVIIECAGNVSAPGLAIELLAPEGTIALLGMLGEPVPISQLNVMLKEARLRGSFAYRPGDFDEAIEHLAAGRVPADDLISSRIPLSGAADAFVELLRPGTSELKILLQPGLGLSRAAIPSPHGSRARSQASPPVDGGGLRARGRARRPLRDPVGPSDQAALHARMI